MTCTEQAFLNEIRLENHDESDSEVLDEVDERGDRGVGSCDTGGSRECGEVGRHRYHFV